MLQPTNHQTNCPYKGTASYYSVVKRDQKIENLVWTYPFPNAEVLKIKSLVSFFTEKLDEVFIDGEKLPKQKTK